MRLPNKIKVYFIHVQTVLFFIVACFFIAPIPLAQEEDIIIFGQAQAEYEAILATLEKCTAENAIGVSFDDVFDPQIEPFQANPTLLHKCIKFDAIAGWRQLRKNALSGYEVAKSGAYRANTYVRQHIGLTGHEKMIEAGLREASFEGEMVGVLATCGFTMGGYCHYEEGPHLYLKSISGEKVEQGVRYVGAEAMVELGNLKMIPDEVAITLGLSAFFEKWMVAVSTRDQKSFEWIAEIAGYGDIEYASFETHKAAKTIEDVHGFYGGLWEAFFDDTSVYRQLENIQEMPRQYFRSYRTITDGGPSEEPIASDYFACVCLENNCTSRWPISSRDAGLGKSYPYICIMLMRNDKGGWKTYLPSRSSNHTITEQPYSPSIQTDNAGN